MVILPLENFAVVEKQGLTLANTRRDLGAVGIGVAVKVGTKLPDLSSEAGLKRALIEAAQGLVPWHPTLGDVDSAQALDEYQAAKRLHKKDWAKARA